MIKILAIDTSGDHPANLEKVAKSKSNVSVESIVHFQKPFSQQELAQKLSGPQKPDAVISSSIDGKIQWAQPIFQACLDHGIPIVLFSTEPDKIHDMQLKGSAYDKYNLIDVVDKSYPVGSSNMACATEALNTSLLAISRVNHQRPGILVKDPEVWQWMSAATQLNDGQFAYLNYPNKEAGIFVSPRAHLDQNVGKKFGAAIVTDHGDLSDKTKLLESVTDSIESKIPVILYLTDTSLGEYVDEQLANPENHHNFYKVVKAPEIGRAAVFEKALRIIAGKGMNN